MVEGERLPLQAAGVPTIDEIAKKDILTKEELAIYLGVPLSTVVALLEKEETFPRCRVGRYVRFCKESVRNWIIDNEEHKLDDE
ncbi:MAG: helix-turn-helix domain-containing protein [Candidatus Anammoxibacter sp.]